mgnify:CR=1 FL=1|jgi:hypothetical protein
MAKVKVNGAPAGPTPKATKFAIIKDQGKIPYGKTADVSMKHRYPRLTARGMGAARKGGSYTGCI